MSEVEESLSLSFGRANTLTIAPSPIDDSRNEYESGIEGSQCAPMRAANAIVEIPEKKKTKIKTKIFLTTSFIKQIPIPSLIAGITRPNENLGVFDGISLFRTSQKERSEMSATTKKAMSGENLTNVHPAITGPSIRAKFIARLFRAKACCN